MLSLAMSSSSMQMWWGCSVELPCEYSGNSPRAFARVWPIVPALCRSSLPTPAFDSSLVTVLAVGALSHLHHTHLQASEPHASQWRSYLSQKVEAELHHGLVHCNVCLRATSQCFKRAFPAEDLLETKFWLLGFQRKLIDLIIAKLKEVCSCLKRLRPLQGTDLTCD